MLGQSGQLPSGAFMTPEVAEKEEELTRKGTYNLTPFETLWQARQAHLLKRGYLLRPRYSKDWKPSWVGTNIQPYYCEDSIVSRVRDELPSQRDWT